MVFLKLKEYNCPTKAALIFSKKYFNISIQIRKGKNVDGTVDKDGPADFRRLKPFKPDGIMVNVFYFLDFQGWLKGEKLKYEGTSSFNHFVRHTSASLSSKINKFNKQSRIT